MVSPADVPPPSIGFLVWHLSLKWRAGLDRELASLGLTAAQYGVLASLYGLTLGGAQPSQRELADFSGLDAMYVSKLIRVLERAGLVERTRNTADTRAVLLKVTAHGAQVLGEARAKVVELEEQRLAPLGGRSGEETAKLRETLRALLAHAGVTADGVLPETPMKGS
jgi:DNA-binding MarR family transcriptional regulator